MLTGVELEKFLNVSRTTLYLWRKKGMPHKRINKMLRYEKEEVMKWIDEQSKNEQ